MRDFLFCWHKISDTQSGHIRFELAFGQFRLTEFLQDVDQRKWAPRVSVAITDILFQEVVMSIKMITAALAVGIVCVATPDLASAGGEIQAYEAPYRGYAANSYYSAGAYAPPPAPYYARPASMYYGGYGCSPCASMPYGASYGRPGLMGGNDVFTAGLLGIGLGYLFFH